MKTQVLIECLLYIIVLCSIGNERFLSAADRKQLSLACCVYGTTAVAAGVVGGVCVQRGWWPQAGAVAKSKYRIPALVALLGAGWCAQQAWKSMYGKRKKEGSEDLSLPLLVQNPQELLQASLLRYINLGKAAELEEELKKNPQAVRGVGGKELIISVIEQSIAPSTKLECIKLLIKYGANLDEQGKRPPIVGGTFGSPLHRALSLADYEICKYLIKEGATCDATYGKGSSNFTAFYALYNGGKQWFELFSEGPAQQSCINNFCALFKTIREQGADLNAIMGYPLGQSTGNSSLFPRNTVLNLICSWGALCHSIPEEIITLLVRYSTINLTTVECPPAFIVAAYYGNDVALSKLHEAQADINIVWGNARMNALDYMRLGLLHKARNQQSTQRHKRAEGYLISWGLKSENASSNKEGGSA